MNDTLIHALTRAVDEPVHTVLHIGAGSSPLQAYGEFLAQRLVLVEGDPDTCADLSVELQLSARSGVQILQRVVLPKSGPVLWHRYNVRRLNAPQAMDGLRAVYPRLVELSQLPLEGVALSTLAGELQTAAGEGERQPAHVLVLDVPGQEAALVTALPLELLQRFRYVAVRASGQPTGEGWAALASTVATLSNACFKVASDTQATADAMWPVAVMRFDAEAFARTQLLERCRSLEDAMALAKAATEKRAAEQAKLAADLQGQIDTLTQAKAAAEKQAAERATQLQQVMQQRDEQAKLVMERQGQIDTLSQTKAAAEKQAAERATQLQQLMQQRDEQAKLAAERQQRLDTLGKEKAELTAERDNLAKERTILVGARDEQTKAAREARQRAGALEVEMAEIQARHGLLQEELVKAEAQIELIADLLLREPAA
jgi:hypothetical protein